MKAAVVRPIPIPATVTVEMTETEARALVAALNTLRATEQEMSQALYALHLALRAAGLCS
jgi:hypothetical protein